MSCTLSQMSHHLPSHLNTMSKQSKSSDIRTCGNIILFHNLLAYLIQGCHDRLCLADCRWRCHLCFDRSIHDTTSDLFCKNQYISRSAAVVLKDLIRVNESGYARPYFGSSSCTECPPTNTAPASFTLSLPPARISPRICRIQAIRETYDVQGYRRFSSHRPYITERVGSGDLSEHIWIIHNRSKEINRLNHRNIICHFVDGSIIGSLDSYY